MSFGRGRMRRPDDWPSSHMRARSDLSERLDGALEPAEAAWLDQHLAACPTCSSAADDYAAQRSELRALRDRTPEPPRDLWARTAAAMESESRFRDTRRRSGNRTRLSLAPIAVLTAAVAVAVVAGTLSSSQRAGDGGTARPTLDVAVGTVGSGSAAPTVPGVTPVPVTAKVEWLSRDALGRYRVQVANVDEVCPPDATEPCDTAAPEQGRAVPVQEELSSVWGSPDGEALVVVNTPGTNESGTVSVVTLREPMETPAGSPEPTPSATVRASAVASLGPTRSLTPSSSPTPGASSAPPSASPSPTPSSTPSAAISPEPGSAGPSPSVAVSASPDAGTIDIAEGIVVVGQAAAYSPSGSWFAFTARPADDSAGPDIYLWKVGDRLATPVTTDHRSAFGSWSGDVIVGSTVVEAPADPDKGVSTELAATSFFLDPETKASEPLPQLGRLWRPSIDPTGRRAVYWAGSLRATDAPGFAPDAGGLVLGMWDADRDTTASPAPAATPLVGDQASLRNESTIAAGKMEDWDARWDKDGSHLALWIADPQDPAVGRLSLYRVDPLDGRIDLQKPLLDAQLATAGFSISDGKLVWAEPSADGTPTGGRIQVLAWTADGSGQVESVPGPVIVIR
jgi:hypothetical protein